MMLTLQRSDSKVSALLGENKGIQDGDVIRPSMFAIPIELGKRKVVYNTLTAHCIETEKYSWFVNKDELIYDENSPDMKELIASDFLVAKELDEAERYMGVLSILRRTERPKPGYKRYTILPTTFCNARCVYCYELGLEYETMSDEIVEQTIRYIRATGKENTRIHFSWFGGEPLLGEDIIDRICRSMRESDINYSSSMISNGSLMTDELAAKAKEDWHLSNIQITLDGREKVYCDRKRYVAYSGSPYRAVLNGIHSMLNKGIVVNIRLNVDEDNLEELMALIDELEVEFREDSGISIYCHGIYGEPDEDTNDSSKILYDGMDKLCERLEEFNRNRRENRKDNNEMKLKRESENRNRGYYDRRGKLKRHYCMVDTPETGPVILPNGELNLCEHIGEQEAVGTVFDETPIENRDSYIERNRMGKEKCRHCGLLPACTDYTGCPTISRDCYREELIREKRTLITLANEKRLPPVNMRIEGRIIRVTEPEEEYLEANREFIVPSYLKPEETIACAEIKKCVTKRGRIWQTEKE